MGSEADSEATALDSDPDWPQVRALQAGDDGALDVLMARHREGMFRFVYRYVQNYETAADLVQETFVRAYFKIGQYKPTAKFVTWLYRIALNLCRDHARSAPTREAARTESFDRTRETTSLNGSERPLVLREPVSPGQNPSEAAASSEEVQRLKAAIDMLPHDLKTALILSAVESRSQKECAELLGTTPKTVETRVYRARKLLGEKLRLFR